jgi:putative holliday junction resolvase
MLHALTRVPAANFSHHLRFDNPLIVLVLISSKEHNWKSPAEQATWRPRAILERMESRRHPTQDGTSPDLKPSPGAILGIDYGRARIGLAIAEAQTGLARPLDTLERVNRNEDMRRLREIVREHRVKQVVVGLPLRLDGTRGDMAEEASRFGNRLHKQLGLEVEMVDERLTSWEAERLLEEQAGRTLATKKAGHRGRVKGKAISVDSMAATVILRDFLARQRVTNHLPGHI